MFRFFLLLHTHTQQVEEDEEKHQAVQEFIGSLMAQTQWTLVHAEERLRSRKFKHARVGPSIHYRLAGAGSGGGGGKGVVKFVVSSSPNGCLRFSARFGRAAPEQFERMVELANWVNSHHTTASMQVNPDTAQGNTTITAASVAPLLDPLLLPAHWPLATHTPTKHTHTHTHTY